MLVLVNPWGSDFTDSQEDQGELCQTNSYCLWYAHRGGTHAKKWAIQTTVTGSVPPYCCSNS